MYAQCQPFLHSFLLAIVYPFFRKRKACCVVFKFPCYFAMQPQSVSEVRLLSQKHTRVFPPAIALPFSHKPDYGKPKRTYIYVFRLLFCCLSFVINQIMENQSTLTFTCFRLLFCCLSFVINQIMENQSTLTFTCFACSSVVFFS